MPAVIVNSSSGTSAHSSTHDISLSFTTTPGNLLLFGTFEVPTLPTFASGLVLCHSSTGLEQPGHYFRYSGAGISVLPRMTLSSAGTVKWVAVEVSGVTNAAPDITQFYDSNYGTVHSFNFTTATANEFALVAEWTGGATGLGTSLNAGWVGRAYGSLHSAYTNLDTGSAGVKTFTSTQASPARSSYIALRFPLEVAGPPPNWTISNPTVNRNAGTVTLVVTADAPAPVGGLSGVVNTYDIVAVAGTHYTAQVAVPFSIAAGQTTGNIVVPILP
jgi:hypothetical protein